MRKDISEKECAETFDKIAVERFTELSIQYARLYQENGKAFIGAFLKYGSVRMACGWILTVYSWTGAMKEVGESGKDFSGWVDKLDLDQKWKRVLSETLLIIYAIKN